VTPNQRAWLRYLTTGDRMHLVGARVTAATREACLVRGWTKETVMGPSGFEITPAGIDMLIDARLAELEER